MANFQDQHQVSLDYASTPRRSHKARVAVLFLVVAWTLFAPGALLALAEFTFDPVHRHWILSTEFNICLDTATICAAIGILVGFIAALLGKTWGYLAAGLNIIALLLLPSLAYA